MLYKLSIKNLRKSISDYSIYFFTLLLGVCVFYMFNAIEDQTAMMEVSMVQSNMISIMNTALSVLSVLVSVILGFLIVYASRFLIRKRTKEFGIYLTLGMRKSAIARLLFVETMLIGAVSLVIGLVMGIVFSQFMSLLVSHMFAADMERFVFVLSKSAVLKTILYYAVIYVVVIIANTIVVVRSKLIDLLLANRKKEEVHLKNPVLCFIIFISASVMLGTAYYNVTANQQAMQKESDVLLMMVLGITGTFLVFWSVSGFVLSVAGKIKGLYYRGTHSFVINETGNRIHSFVMAGSMICLLLFVTISTLSAAFSLQQYKGGLLKKRVPVSVSMKTDSTDGHSVESVLNARGFDMAALDILASLNTWQCDTVTRQSVLGEYGKQIAESNTMWEDYMAENLEMIYMSDYNAAARCYGFAPVSLKADEYMVFAENPESAFNEFKNQVTDTADIVIGNQKLHQVSSDGCEGFLMMSDSLSYNELVIIPDTVSRDDVYGSYAYLIANYKNGYDTKEFHNYMDGGEFDALVNPQGIYEPGAVIISTRSAVTDNSTGTSGIMVFIALYLGIVFMICSAALLALKSMSDALDGRGKYKVLRQLGVNEREVNHTLFAQMAIFFGFPLILAVIHSIFGIQVLNTMLSVYDSSAMLPGLIMASVMIVVIYGGYFAVSYQTCKKAIKEK